MNEEMGTGWFFNRYKASLDIFWLRDESLEESRSPPGNRRRPRSPLVAFSLLRFLLKMKHVSYNGYVITVTANNEKGTWRSHVIITWYEGEFDLHDEVCFTTESKAEEHAIELGKHWVNNRLQRMQGPT
jgi:hypothetical protein